MQHFKQRAKKWLSGFLAVVMLFGMLPSMGLFSPAYAAGGTAMPPDSIKNTNADVKYGKIEGRNPITGELIMNVPGHTSVIPRLFEFAGDDGTEVPGFCGDHKLNFDGKVVPSLTWKDPVPVVGTKYEKVLPIVANFMVSYKQAEWMADQLSGMGDMTEAELDEWCAANAGDCPLGRSPAKFFCPKTHRSNRSDRYLRLYIVYRIPFRSFVSLFSIQ